MRIFTTVCFVLTILVGIAAFNTIGESAELLKLLYAYFALTTVVCGLITMAARRPARTAPVQAIETPQV
jgi:hypothetical protein